MTLTVLTVLAVMASLLGAVLGRVVLDRLSPAFTSRPRLGMALWTAAASSWVVATIALGPLLAWTFNAQLLPGEAGAVCQRCLAATHPFGGHLGGWTSRVPSLVFLAPSAFVVVVLALAAVRGWWTRASTARAHTRVLRLVAERSDVAGHEAWVIPTGGIAAYSLPGPRGAIVVSAGAVERLDDQELSAVLAHERAHLAQRHHLVLGWVGALTRAFGWVPLVGAAGRAVRLFAEMAADDAASERCGDRVVARALVKLGGGVHAHAPSPALHAAHDYVAMRVRRLHTDRRRVDVPTSLVGATLGHVAACLGVGLLVGVPYLDVAISGVC